MPAKHTYAIKIVAKSSLIKTRSKQKVSLSLTHTLLQISPFRCCSQFQTEIKIHRSLRHLNIVKFERFFEDKEFAYIVMELCANNVS